MSIWRLVATVAGWALASALLGLLVVMAGPRLLGGHSYTVLSNSMSPAIETGDQVIALPRPILGLSPGEIVVFADPEGSGRLFQHRVQRVWRRDGEVEVVTMGDANSGYERWSLPADARVEQVESVIPAVGFLIGRLGEERWRSLASGVAWLAFLTIFLVTIWRRPAGPGGEVAA